MFKLMDKKIIVILCKLFLLKPPYDIYMFSRSGTEQMSEPKPSTSSTGDIKGKIEPVHEISNNVAF